MTVVSSKFLFCFLNSFFEIIATGLWAAVSQYQSVSVIPNSLEISVQEEETQ